MENVVIDPARPDQNGVLPKMHELAKEVRRVLKPTAVFNVTASDWLCSTIDVTGSFDAKETWVNGIYQNSRYFRFAIQPKNKRYYHEGDTLTVELQSQSYKVGRFRKYTGPLDKILAKINDWLAKEACSCTNLS